MQQCLYLLVKNLFYIQNRIFVMFLQLPVSYYILSAKACQFDIFP